MNREYCHAIHFGFIWPKSDPWLGPNKSFEKAAQQALITEKEKRCTLLQKRTCIEFWSLMRGSTFWFSADITLYVPKIIIIFHILVKVEISGMKSANIRDAVALMEMADILERGMAKNEDWDELKVAKKLKKLRGQQALNKGLSFPSISAYGANGAVIHYKPNNKTNTKIGRDAFFLLDSGTYAIYRLLQEV